MGSNLQNSAILVFRGKVDRKKGVGILVFRSRISELGFRRLPLRFEDLYGVCFDSRPDDVFGSRVRNTDLMAQEVSACLFIAVPHEGAAIHGMGIIEGIGEPLFFCDDGPPCAQKLMNRIEHLFVDELQCSRKDILFLIF